MSSRDAHLLNVSYAYVPLHESEIRLLEIQRGSWDDPIVVAIQVANLNNSPIYECLSYTWYDPGEEHLTHAGRLSEGLLHLTSNLHSALRALRYKDRSRTIWADAICINQTDLKERSEQVKIMFEIYEEAQRVIIWLGEAKDDSHLAVQYLYDFNKISRPVGRLTPRTEWKSRKGYGSGAMLLSQLPHYPEYAMSCFFQRPWFRRVWVQQEAIAAKSLQICCGRDTLDWESLIPFVQAYRDNTAMDHFGLSLSRAARAALSPVTNIQDHRGDGFTDRPRAFSTRRHRNRSTPLATLFWQLIKCRDCLSTDPRDKVLALQYIANQDFNVGYDAPVQKLYVHVAMAFIENTDVKFLAEVGLSSQRLEGLPSWVPDWSFARSDAYIPPHRELWHASGGSQPCYRSFGPWPKCKLLAAGVVFDYIESVSGTVKLTTEDFKEVVDILLKFENAYYLKLRDGWKHDHSELEYDYFATTVCKLAGSRQPATQEDIRTMIKQRRSLDKAALKLMRQNSFDESSSEQSFLQRWQRRGTFTSNQICVSSKGYFSLGPAEARIGDVIAVLSGFNMPLIMRPVGNDYQIVGRAYTHKLMNGDILKRKHDKAVLYRENKTQSKRQSRVCQRPSPWWQTIALKYPIQYEDGDVQKHSPLLNVDNVRFTESKAEWVIVTVPGTSYGAFQEFIHALDSGNGQQVTCPHGDLQAYLTRMTHEEARALSHPIIGTVQLNSGLDSTESACSELLEIGRNSAVVELDATPEPLPHGWRMADFHPYCPFFINTIRKYVTTRHPSSVSASGSSLYTKVPGQYHFNTTTGDISWIDPRLLEEHHGPLPSGWQLEFRFQDQWTYFVHKELGIISKDDPRFDGVDCGPLPPGWRAGRTWDLEEGRCTAYHFIHEDIGFTTFDDPCLPTQGLRPDFGGISIV